MHAGNYSLGDNFRPQKPLNHRYFFSLSEKLQRTVYKNLKETVGTDSRYGFLINFVTAVDISGTPISSDNFLYKMEL